MSCIMSFMYRLPMLEGSMGGGGSCWWYISDTHASLCGSAMVSW